MSMPHCTVFLCPATMSFGHLIKIIRYFRWRTTFLKRFDLKLNPLMHKIHNIKLATCLGQIKYTLHTANIIFCEADLIQQYYAVFYLVDC